MSRHFTQDHEWIEVADGVGTVGITDYAQGQLGDITFVELPEVGSTVSKGGSVSVVDSVKAASDVYTPVSGEVVEVNDGLGDAPGTVNEDALGKGWFAKVKMSNKAELDGLMDDAAYKTFCEGLH